MGTLRISLLPPVDYTIPEYDAAEQLTLADGSLADGISGSPGGRVTVESEFYTFYGVNSDGTEGWYQYDSMGNLSARKYRDNCIFRRTAGRGCPAYLEGISGAVREI